MNEITDKQHARPNPAWKIPNKLNAFLVVAVSGCALLWLWLGSRYGNRTEVLILMGIAYSYLMLTNYSLMHEAAHDKLHTNKQLNYLN